MRLNNLALALALALAVLPAGQSPAQENLTPAANTPEEVIAYVERGARYVLEHGEEKAFRDLTEPDGPWFEADWYLCINSFDGYVVAHYNKKLIGKTLFHIRDIKGNAFYSQQQAIAQSGLGKGWLVYWWPKPGSVTPSRKLAYVMRIPGKRLWISSGNYDLTDEKINRILAEQGDILGKDRQ